MTNTEGMKVLVTGCNGFVASYIVKELLEHGYSVVGTVRSLAQQSLYSHVLELPNASTHLTLKEADILIEGSFDNAVSECNIVIHTACPFYLTTYDIVNDINDAHEKLVVPSLHGTRNVLRSVEKYHEKIDKFVYTSSTGALIGYGDREFYRTYTEDDWNEKSSLTNNPFAYSKAITEREVWNWWDKLKSEHPDTKLQVSTVLPVFVLGPILQIERVKVNGIDHLNTSCRIMLNNLFKKLIDPEKGHKIGTNGFSIVDVRDVAKIHRLVLESPETDGERLIAFSAKGQWIKMNRIILEHFPQFKDTIPLTVESDYSEEEGFDRMVRFSSDKLLKLFPDFNYVPVEKCIIEMYNCLIDNGLAEMLRNHIEETTNKTKESSDISAQ